MSEFEDLKAKYNLTDEALAEIKGRIPAAAPPPQTFKVPLDAGDSAFEGLPSTLLNSLKSASGEVSLVEMIFLMNYLDNKEERRREREDQRRLAPLQTQGRDDLTLRMLEEMREARHQNEKENLQTRSYVETLLLGKKLEDAEKRGRDVEAAYKASSDYISEQQKETQAMQFYTQKLEQIVGGARGLGPQQQNDFLTDVFSEVGTEVKQEFKDRLIKSVRGEVAADKLAPSGGIPKSYWDLADRALGVLEKYAARSPAPQPPLRPIQPYQPDAGTAYAGAIPAPLGPPTAAPTPLPPSTRPEEASYEKTVEPVNEAPPAQIYGSIPREEPTPSPKGETPPPKYINPVEAMNFTPPPPPPPQPTPTPPPPPPPQPPEGQVPTVTLAELTDIRGIGPKWAQELKQEGIPDIKTLANTSPEDLASRLEIPLERAKDWTDQAKDLN